jgi:tetratricopeptide (TPR) repeat protein
MSSRMTLICLALVLLAPLRGAGAAAPSEPEKLLLDLATRQQALFVKSEKEGDNLDEANFRQATQKLVQEYDDFLKKYPKYAPAYAAYGTMLSRLDMSREAAAVLTRGDDMFMAMSKEPGASTPAFRRAWALLKNQLGNYTAEEGHPIEASAFFLTAIDLVPDEPLYHYQLGMLLAEAHDDFVKAGNQTRAEVEKSMQQAFRRAAELAPARFEFQYRYAESFYDVAEPDWDAALRCWAALEENAGSEVERDTMRLHAANVLIHQGKFDHARLMLTSVDQPVLAAQKQKLVAQLPAEPAK